MYNKNVSYLRQIMHQHLCHKIFWPVQGRGQPYNNWYGIVGFNVPLNTV